MEFHEKVTVWSCFLSEEKNNTTLTNPNHAITTTSPSRRSSSEPDRPTSSPARISSSSTNSALAITNYTPTASPETPWTILSPDQHQPAAGHNSLLYTPVSSLHRRDGCVLSLAVSSRNLVFTGTKSRRIHAWKIPHFAEAGHVRASFGDVGALLAHGRILFSAHGDRRVRAWGVSATESFNPRKIATIPRRNSFTMFSTKTSSRHKDHISCLAYNHEEKLLYTGSWDKTVKVWNIAENRCEDSFVAHEGRINGIAINNEDGCVFTCSSDGSVKIWRRVFGESSHMLSMTLRFQLSPVNALALVSSSPARSCILYSGSSDGLINFWVKENTSGRFNHMGFLQGHHFAVLCLTALADLVLSGSEDATIRIWRREEVNCLHTCAVVINGHRGPVRCLVATQEKESSRDSMLVYSASLDLTLKIWRVKVCPMERVSLQNSNRDDQKTESDDYATSPVLSPSWVVKKLQV